MTLRLLSAVAREHGADSVDRGIEPAGDFAIGVLQRPRAGGGGVELRGESRAIGLKRVQLGIECGLATVGLLPPLDSSRQGVEREIILRDYALENIISIKMGGMTYIVRSAIEIADTFRAAA